MATSRRNWEDQIEITLSQREARILANLLGHVVLSEDGPAGVIYSIVQSLEGDDIYYNMSTDQWFGRIKESKKNKQRRINKILKRVK